MGQATVDHMANFQQLLNVIASQSTSSSPGGGGPGVGGQLQQSMGISVGGGGKASSSSKNNNSTPNHLNLNNNPNSSSSNNNGLNLGNEDLQTMLPIFSELVTLTNTIVAAQEAGDTERVDAVTTQLCERVMKDGQAMGVLSVAMNNPVGIAGMNAVFQGMMNMEPPTAGAAAAAGPGGMSVGGVPSKNSYSGVSGNSSNSGSVAGISNASVKRMNREEGEALRKAAYASVSQGQRLRQQQSQQQQQNKGGSSSTAPVFSMIFGGGSSSSNAAATTTSTAGGGGGGGSTTMPLPNMLPPGVSIPPLPPPPGGWPPGAAPAAAAAAAMAAFSTTFNNNSSDVNNNNRNLNQNRPSSNNNHSNENNNFSIPMMGGSGVGGPLPGGPPDLNSTAWLDYYDACLRAGGLKGGIAEFEEYARMSGGNNAGHQGTTSMSGNSAMGGHHRSMPQDRPISGRMGGGGKGGGNNNDNDLPAQFEYDGGSIDTNDDNGNGVDQQQLSEQELQQLALEEEEKRKKKAAKKRDKKARQKERAKKESEAKAALAALKKREKAIASWRSRVVQACGSSSSSSGMGGDGRRMDVLVGESPYKNYTYDPTTASATLPEEDEEDDETDRPQSHEEYLIKHMDWFLTNCLQKYPSQSQYHHRHDNDEGAESALTQQPFANNVARERLAKYILSVSLNVVMLQSPTKSRNAIHSAAYRNDADFIRWIIQSSDTNSSGGDKMSYLESLCDDAGWSPLHYAIAGGAQNVVELLLKEGCNVQMRTDRSLTCFNRRRGNGITARELAIVLQSGAVDDDLTSNADILDEVVDNRIDAVSAPDKAAYMRILKVLEGRLEHVEQNGYSPPPAVPSKVEQQQEGTTAPESSGNDTVGNSTTTNKKPKKKKKKQQQQQQSNTFKAPSAPASSGGEPEFKSAPSDSTTDDTDHLTDPVAIALLGMGFTEDQIKSAARALGGFERATADDMVMWILGGGEIADDEGGGSGSAADQGDNAITTSEDPMNSNDNNDDTKQSPDDAVLTKAQKKAASRAKREAEELARKNQEELAAAQRAASKREEQRRIRREWNEREQVRQAEEKAAKVAEAMERRRRAEMEKMLLLPPKGGVGGVLPVATVGGAAAGMGMPPVAGVHVSPGGKHHHHHSGGHHPHHHGGGGGPPLTIIAGGQKMPSSANKQPKSVGSNMGIPQAPTIRAPKILTRPSNAPPGTLPGGQQQSVVIAGNQPLFAATSTTSGGVAKPASPPRGGHAKPYNPSINDHHHHGHQPTAILQKNSSSATAGPHHGHTMSTNSGSSRIHQHAPPAPEYHHHPGHHHTNPASNFAYKDNPNNNAAATPPPFQNHPSQVGSGGGMSGPPGFQPGISGDTEQPPVETNPMGMIRATAREFVPTSFVPTPAESNNASSTAQVPSMSAQPATNVPVSTSVSSPPPPTRSLSNDHSAAANLLVEPMSSLLSSFGADTSNTPPATLVPMGVGGTMGNGTNKDMDSTAPSAASSITGLSGLPPTSTMGEENITSRVGSVMTFESTSSSGGGGGGGIQTSSILESISYGGVDQVTSGSALGSGAGIWGGSNNVNQSASLGLAGLNFSSFMGGGGGDNGGDSSQNNNSNNDGNANIGGGSTTWGTSTGGGSIW
ncbi:hypothetical protein ACHAXR_009646 [Thalassiosira sp. AJA248-18]